MIPNNSPNASIFLKSQLSLKSYNCDHNSCTLFLLHNQTYELVQVTPLSLQSCCLSRYFLVCASFLSSEEQLAVSKQVFSRSTLHTKNVLQLGGGESWSLNQEFSYEFQCDNTLFQEPEGCQGWRLWQFEVNVLVSDSLILLFTDWFWQESYL